MIKRLFDLLLSTLGLIVLSPVLIFLVLWIWIVDRGPAFFVQERIGRYGQKFKMFKFRTMIVNAAASGQAITVGADSRITPVGRVLRKTKLDEIPQLINVWLGQMSFVGPRPEVEKYVLLYTPEQRRVLDLKPGITDLASYAFFNESEILAESGNPEDFYRGVLMPEKIRLNLEYAARASVVSDLTLIVATVARALGLQMNLFAKFKIRPPAFEP